MRQKQKADDDASDHIAHHDLEEREVCVIGKTGNADNGESASLGGNDREGDRPPRYVAPGEKVVAEGALLLAKAQAEEGDACQVKSDDGEIEFVEAHVSALHKSLSRACSISASE